MVAKLFEYHKLDENSGLSWEEIELGRFTAQAITETTRLNNYQQYADTLKTVTPTVSGLATLVTDRVYARISKPVIAQMAMLMQEALERKKDGDCLTTIDGATNSQPGAGNTLTTGVLTAHVANIRGNTTEGADEPVYHVLHEFQAKDILDEIVAGVGTYPLPAGITEQVWKMGLRGEVAGGLLYTDNNIGIDSADDAKGGSFVRKGGLFIQGREKRKPTVRDEEYGGGADKVFLYEEYIPSERTPNATSVLIRETYSDALAPTT